MEFLNPAALYALLFLPLLLIAYLIKGTPRRLIFSSLLLLREFSSRSIGRRWGSLYLPPIFFLQLLLLLLLILALGEPVFSTRPLKIAVVFDNSASMQALEGQKRRFELAQEEAQDLIQTLSTGAQIDLYLLVPRLERIGEAMAPAQATALIRTLKAYDMGDPPGNIGEELSRLMKGKGYERLFFLTDHPLRGQAGAAKVISVGRTKDNLALTSFQLSRPSLASSQLEAKVEVTSFSSRDEKVRVALKGGGKVLSSKEIALASGKTATVPFEGVPSQPHFAAEIDARDALPLDNQRYAVPPPAETLKILGVSPRPQALQSLRAIPGLSLKVVAPEGYAKNGEEGHSLEIFHFSAPAVLPRHHALFVLPPKNNPLVAEERSIARPVISSWRDPHPLTRYVNFALLRPNYARAFKPLLSGESIIKSPEGPLMMAFEYQGYRYLVLGFDPFPYLGQKNLPVSVLTLNLLGWFYETQGNSGIATGATLELQDSGATVMTPNQDKIQIKESPPVFSRTFYQGLYQIIRSGKKEFVAVNLGGLQESDLNNPTPIEIREEASMAGSRSFLFPVWPYLLLLSILLFFLEWYLNPPVRQS